MSDEALSKEQIEQLKATLLAKVPEGESQSIGNKSLREQLDWEKDRYWDIRNRLIEDGVLVKGGGKGGSVKRTPNVVENSAEAAEADEPVAAVPAKESDLYEPLLKELKENWGPEHRLENLAVEITAVAGSKATGKWTRPDITMVGYKLFPFVPGKHFDLTVFEVKPHWAVDVTVVYEALAHRRAATRAYALLHVPEDRKEALEPALEEICGEAKKFGVGVITVSQPDDYDTWDELVEPTRHEPDPERMNDFLAQQLSQSFRDEFMKWFR
jgi:hypothetical protein